MKNYLRVLMTNNDFNEAVPEGKNGVYVLHVINSKDVAMPIDRLLGKDNEGILYIGSAPQRTLRERLADFRKSVLPDYNSARHDAGAFYKNHSLLSNRFPLDMLAFSIIISDEANALESQLILDYKEKFGEIPPLNTRN